MNLRNQWSRLNNNTSIKINFSKTYFCQFNSEISMLYKDGASGLVRDQLYQILGLWFGFRKTNRKQRFLVLVWLDDLVLYYDK